MRKAKQRALEARGWHVGSAEEFLELTPEEAGKASVSHRHPATRLINSEWVCNENHRGGIPGCLLLPMPALASRLPDDPHALLLTRIAAGDRDALGGLAVYLDPSGRATATFNNWGTPTMYVLDAKGRVVFPGTTQESEVLLYAEAVLARSAQ